MLEVISGFEFALDSAEASVAGSMVQVDVRRFPLRIRNTTIDADRFAKLSSLVSRSLARRGLWASGRLAPSVRTALSLLADNQVTVSITGLDSGGKDIAVFAATDGAQALRISQPGGEDLLHFRLFPAGELIETLATELPAVAAARTRTYSVESRLETVEPAMRRRRPTAAEETEAFGSLQVTGTLNTTSSPRRGSRADADVLRELLSGKRRGGGFMVAVSGRRGVSRGADPIGWFDTDQGRYLVETVHADGVMTARYRPAGRADVAKALRQLVSSVY